MVSTCLPYWQKFGSGTSESQGATYDLQQLDPRSIRCGKVIILYHRVNISIVMRYASQSIDITTG